MDKRGKIIVDEKQFRALMPLLKKFPTIHNKLKTDFEVLIELTEQNKATETSFHTLCRACLRNLFSIIEADLFYFNLLDKYENYEDKHPFLNKFKKTFKQICKTWDKEDLQKEYFTTKLEDLKKLKIIRDRLTHPKEEGDIIEPSFSDFENIKKVFSDYEKFLLTIMSNFFFSIEIPTGKLKNDI